MKRTASWICAAFCMLLLLTGCGPRPATATVYESAAPRELAQVSESDTGAAYVLNPGSMRFHLPGCVWAGKIAPDRRVDWTGDRDTLIEVGYQSCHYCKP